MQPFIIQCSILPFLPMSHKPKHTQEKKIISAHLQFCILCDLKTLISVCILKMKRIQTGHRIEMQLYSCHFPLFLSFSKMWLMVLFFTNQKTLSFMRSIVHVHSSIPSVVTKYLAVHFVPFIIIEIIIRVIIPFKRTHLSCSEKVFHKSLLFSIHFYLFRTNMLNFLNCNRISFKSNILFISYQIIMI